MEIESTWKAISQDERKLVYRCRRGTRELDCILTGFFEHQYYSLNTHERKMFKKLLEVEDCTLIDWLCNRNPVEEYYYLPIVERIISTTLRS